MQVSPRKVVHIHYTLTNDDGEILDSSRDQSPLAYIHGMGNIIPGLENALTGRVVGDKLKVTVPPEAAYGLRDDDLIQSVPKTAFEEGQEILPGMQFQAQSPEGIQLLTVIGVDDEEVVLDGNHPMAGLTLNFEVEITDIRDATPDELNHGHVHGPGGHHHG
jgi:FKBP-type peptidyl-prolyl cis-trans isomerase SlyD